MTAPHITVRAANEALPDDWREGERAWRLDTDDGHASGTRFDEIVACPWLHIELMYDPDDAQDDEDRDPPGYGYFVSLGDMNFHVCLSASKDRLHVGEFWRAGDVKTTFDESWTTHLSMDARALAAGLKMISGFGCTSCLFGKPECGEPDREACCDTCWARRWAEDMLATFTLPLPPTDSDPPPSRPLFGPTELTDEALARLRVECDALGDVMGDMAATLGAMKVNDEPVSSLSVALMLMTAARVVARDAHAGEEEFMQLAKAAWAGLQP